MGHLWVGVCWNLPHLFAHIADDSLKLAVDDKRDSILQHARITSQEDDLLDLTDAFAVQLCALTQVIFK